MSQAPEVPLDVAVEMKAKEFLRRVAQIDYPPSGPDIENHRQDKQHSDQERQQDAPRPIGHEGPASFFRKEGGRAPSGQYEKERHDEAFDAPKDGVDERTRLRVAHRPNQANHGRVQIRDTRMQADNQHSRQRPQFFEPRQTALVVCGNCQRGRALERSLIIHDLGSRGSKPVETSRLIAR